ncbi:penicillin-binding transpeptidase domain-containing protein, partial [Kitasatospora nipponensis]|uniref:penicillin-binding transpeptidase domain-containing protein n=1 Tax=Kitasatospora nipponensis TaxID=258049 RepID=UPI0031DC38A7
ASGNPLLEIPSMVLGTQEVSPMVMANAYATFAARGKYCSPVAVKSVVNTAGTQLPVPQANCTQVISDTTADGINTLLLGVTEKGTGSSLTLDDRRPIAGKTGTTDKRYAAWFTGYTPELSTSVWLGGPTVNVSMKNIKIGPTRFNGGVYGATGPGPIWQMAMSAAV